MKSVVTKQYIENRLKDFRNRLEWAHEAKTKAEKDIEEYTALIVEWEEAQKNTGSLEIEDENSLRN